MHQKQLKEHLEIQNVYENYITKKKSLNKKKTVLKFK